MTAVLTAPALDERADVIGSARLLAGLDRAPILGYGAHQSVHGRLPAVGRERLAEQLDAVRLLGRGGAGFPVARKMRATGPGGVVVVNGMESEPASRKDRTLMRRAPHLVIDGAVAVAAALDAREVVIAVADPLAGHSIHAACNDRADTAHVRVVAEAAAFVGGEARSVVRRLNGGPAVPTGRRILPSLRGVDDRPTFLSNAETFAQIAVLVRLGAGAFARSGETAEPGTTLVTVSGAVARPGVVEIPSGLPTDVLLRSVGAGAAEAYVIGGYHGTWMLPDPSIRLSRAGMINAGGTFGAGVVAVVGADTCSLGELARVTHWLAAQSARQCGPCTNGLPALSHAVNALYRGEADTRDADTLAGLVDGRGACAHPDGAARFVRSALAVLRPEIDTHARGGCGRPIRGHLSLGQEPSA